MAEAKKKSSWEIPPPGPGTLSGFLVAWVFVAGVIAIAIFLMSIGKGPMPLRVVGYDISVDGKPPAEAALDKLLASVRQTNPMVLALQGTSEEMTNLLRIKLEMREENVVREGSAAILSRYRIEKSEGARAALIRYGETGKFGIVNLDLSESVGDSASGKLKESAGLARDTFGKIPHAILVLGDKTSVAAPPGYVEATVENKEACDWRLFIPEGIKDKLKECYVPADNKVVKDFSERLPIVARFVFGEKDFE